MDIKDLPKDETIGKDEIKRVRGGAYEALYKVNPGPVLSVTARPVEDLSFTVACGNIRAIIDIDNRI